MPDAVVFPACTEHVCAVMRYAYDNRIPVVPGEPAPDLPAEPFP